MATDFGKDVWATDSIRSGRLVTGVTLVAQAAYRRLITPRGTLLPFYGDDDDHDYGFDVAAYVGRSPKNAVAALPGLIRAELKKDDRIDEVTATVSITTDGPSTRLVISIACTTDDGPFTLVMAVADLTAELLGITERAA